MPKKMTFEEARAKLLKELNGRDMAEYGNDLEKEQDAGGDPADWADRWQQFGTRATGLRTLETRAAGLTLAENEARALVPRVRELLGTVNRTRFPDLNKLIIAGQTKTGNENEIKLGIAIGSLIPVYARVLKPVGQVGQTDMANAQHLLEQKWATGQMGAALDQFEVELHSAKDALAQARKEYGASGPSLPGRPEKKAETPPPANPAAPPAAGQGATKPATTPAAGSGADIVPPSLKGRNLQRNGNGFFRDKITGEVFDEFGKPINPTKLLGENNG